MNRTRGIGLGVVLVLATAACATRSASPAQIGVGREDDTVLVTVRNHQFQDGVIYANWNGLRRRVGMVVGKTTETFRVTWRTNQIRLEVDFIGGGELFSEPIPVWAGEHIDFSFFLSGFFLARDLAL